MTAWAGHGPGGAGEPLAIVLRPGNAGSNTAADHIEATRLALAQLPRHQRRKALIRADSAGGTHEFLTWLTARSRRLSYSVGLTITGDIQDAISKIPAGAWTQAYDGDGEPRQGAWIAEITGMLDLDSWPAGMRVIVRKERPHPGAQLRFTDIDGHQFTCLATGTKGGQLPDLELRHRRRARCEDRIRCAKDTGLRNLPEGIRAEPALVRDRRAGLRAAGLDPDARPRRPGPPLGAQTAPAAGLRRRRAAGARRAPPAAATRRTLALGPRDHRRDQPAGGPPVRLTSPNHPSDHEGEATRTCGTPPARHDSRARPGTENSPQPTPQANHPGSREIEASRRAIRRPVPIGVLGA
jgi:hypothetical protein